MFIDEAKICLVSGRGGDGIISFRREKYRPLGGPNGGDGGQGGSVVLQATPRMRTLLQFRDKIHWKAGNGTHGGSDNKTGAKAKDLIVQVPVGTVIKQLQTEEVLADLTEPGQKIVLAHGGESGRGNFHFKNSSRQAPRIREKGEWGEERWIKLELKLLADVGLIGCPNAGKSTLLSQISAKRPKIASYPFTTIQPNLGVVWIDEFSSFVAVDVPGLIEGAHEGKGLGIQFLKHIERTRLLIHVIDISGWEGRDPIADYNAINEELESFSPSLPEKPQFIVGNKIDTMSEEQIKDVVERFSAIGVDIHVISAVSGKGIPELKGACYQHFLEMDEFEAIIDHSGPEESKWKVYRPQGDAKDFTIDRENEGFSIAGGMVSRLSRLSLEEPDAQDYLDEQLQRLGIIAALRRYGAKAGDRIKMGKREFEYNP
jgi:GTP-binding protein